MDEVIKRFNASHVRYLLIGGQALRLEGMPRFSMDWDFLIPPHDLDNLARINAVLEDDLDVPVLPLGSRGENFIQTYQTRWGIIQFHLVVPGIPAFEAVEQRAVLHADENGTPIRCLSGRDLLACKRSAGRAQDLLDARFLEQKAQAGLL